MLLMNLLDSSKLISRHYVNEMNSKSSPIFIIIIIILTTTITPPLFDLYYYCMRYFLFNNLYIKLDHLMMITREKQAMKYAPLLKYKMKNHTKLLEILTIVYTTTQQCVKDD